MIAGSSIRGMLRELVPFGAWQTAGFVKRLPSYWRTDRSNALRIRERRAGLPLYVTRTVSVHPPESITAYLNWQSHGVEINESSREALDFLELAKPRRSLIDVGAQTGFMSALFARSRTGPAQILSVEPDAQVLPLLHRAVDLNSTSTTDWQIEPVAVSATNGRITMPVSNRLYEPTLNELPDEIEVESVTLADLLKTIDWQPDIIKVDVESFEHEIICSSLTLFERLKPALQLEVHWGMLAARDREPADFLAPLADMGYRGIRRHYRNYDAWRRAGQSEAVSRLALEPR
jgi:FkbM family methyltransferase